MSQLEKQWRIALKSLWPPLRAGNSPALRAAHKQKNVPKSPSTRLRRELSRTVREAIRLKHYSICIEEAYSAWIRRYVRFHNKRHPLEMGSAEIAAFLTHLAVKEHVAAST